MPADTLSEYQRRRREVEARLLALDSQERELAHDAGRQAEAARLAAHAEAFCRRVRQGLDQVDFHRKRELLELLVDCVVVTGDAVEIRYAITTGPEGEREPFCRLRTDYQEPVPGARRQRPGPAGPQAPAGAREGARVLRRPAGLPRRPRGVRRRSLLGEGAGEARSRGAADAAAVRQAVREDEQARRGGRRGLLRGGAAPRDAVRAGQGRGPAGAADAAPGARATPRAADGDDQRPAGAAGRVRDRRRPAADRLAGAAGRGRRP